MKRRQRPDVTPADGVPIEIAEGPRVSRWAYFGDLERLASTSPKSAARRDLVDAAMLSARRRWWLARRQWMADTGVGDKEASKLFGLRRPYFDPPGTPFPDRTGYAAEPQASSRAWVRTATSSVVAPHGVSVDTRARGRL